VVHGHDNMVHSTKEDILFNEMAVKENFPTLEAKKFHLTLPRGFAQRINWITKIGLINCAQIIHNMLIEVKIKTEQKNRRIC